MEWVPGDSQPLAHTLLSVSLPPSSLLLQGRWGTLSTLEQLQALLDSLDSRGHRELALGEALGKHWDTIAMALQVGGGRGNGGWGGG